MALPKHILVLMVYSTPDQKGFHDVLVRVEQNPFKFYSWPCRAGPNWRTPRIKGSRPWHEAYDCIASKTVCDYKVIPHDHYGVAVQLNGGKEVPSCNPQPNPNGTIFTRVYIHRAQCPWYNPLWPGSAGCPTLQPVHWRSLETVLPLGEQGKLLVYDARRHRG